MSDCILPLTGWHSPVFLVNSRFYLFSATSETLGCTPSMTLAPLIPKLRGQFAEFLHHGSLKHLRLFASPTCVGLRYGQLLPNLRGFSWKFFEQVGLSQATRFLKCLGVMNGGFAYRSSYAPKQTSISLIALSTPSPHRNKSRCRNIDLLAIGYAIWPRLRFRLTLGGLALPRNPWVYGVRVFHPHYRYSCQHSHFRYLQHPSRNTFSGLRNALLPRALRHIHSFGAMLRPT